MEVHCKLWKDWIEVHKADPEFQSNINYIFDTSIESITAMEYK